MLDQAQGREDKEPSAIIALNKLRSRAADAEQLVATLEGLVRRVNGHDLREAEAPKLETPQAAQSSRVGLVGGMEDVVDRLQEANNCIANLLAELGTII